MAPLLELALGKVAELAGKALAKGVDYAGRKLGLTSPPEEPTGPIPMKDLMLRRRQEEQAIAHKVKPSGPL